MADEIFNQADADKDQGLDINEFRKLVAQNFGNGSTNFAGNATGGGGQYAGNSYGSSSSSAAYGNQSGTANLTGGASGGAEANYSSYEQSSYAAASNGNVSGFDASATGSFGVGGLRGYATTETAGVSSGSTFETSSAQQQQFQVNGSNAQNLYQDPNPQIIRRAAQGGVQTYTQNVKNSISSTTTCSTTRSNPLIIKEVRPPQPPPPPPLRIRQQAPPLPQPPPLVLREKPPTPPATTGPQTVVRPLPALPMPPRSVIIERLPPLPPNHVSDIIIERWLPYQVTSKRKTIVQRAEGVKEYPKPRNIIIQYEPIQVRIVRQFQRLGITQENPQLYIQRYGATLLDPQTLLQQARAAGVIENISPPTTGFTTGASSTSFNGEFNSSSSGVGAVGGVGFTAGGNAGIGLSSFQQSAYQNGQQGNASYSGFESAQSGSPTAGFRSPQGGSPTTGFGAAQGGGFELSSFSSQGGSATFGGAGFGGAGAAAYDGYGTTADDDTSDPINAAFLAADLNKDGGLDFSEFRRFLSAQLRNRL